MKNIILNYIKFINIINNINIIKTILVNINLN